MQEPNTLPHIYDMDELVQIMKRLREQGLAEEEILAEIMEMLKQQAEISLEQILDF